MAWEDRGGISDWEEDMIQHSERRYTSEDYWKLPEGKRAELIDGKFYDMAPPGFVHQKLVAKLTRVIGNHVEAKGGGCEVMPAPFAVNLNADDEKWVEPDISVICDREKLSERGCEGAPDFVIEVVSPSSRKMDYAKKTVLYLDAGVREYWIVDPLKGRTTVYRFEEDVAPIIFPFGEDITVGIYGDLEINMGKQLE